jgi:hypothetical protein
MAVYQISRIQIRRGRAKSGTGLPQLASGEMAWAIDTQELWIGNGSVSEGSPAVGNTKVITVNDLSTNGNLLGLIQYIYKIAEPSIVTGPDAGHPIMRPIQDKLDDRITTIDFGTIGDDVGDDTDALQRAIDQLYLNNSAFKASNDSASGVLARAILNIPAGTFKTTRPLYVPSYATLIGAGADKSIIKYQPATTQIVGRVVNANATLLSTDADQSMIGSSITGNGIPLSAVVVDVEPGVGLTMSANANGTYSDTTFTLTPSGAAIQFVNDSSAMGNPSSLASTTYENQPRSIQLSGLTVHASTGKNTCLQLDAVRDSLFEDLNLTGDWVASEHNDLSCGVAMNAFSSLVTSENNIFRNIKFVRVGFAVSAKHDVSNNIFENCYIETARQGFVLGSSSNAIGFVNGPRQTQITNCKFYDVKWHGVYLEKGRGNAVTDCKFINVGNYGGSSYDAAYPIVYFSTAGNVVTNMQTDRADRLAISTTEPYIPEFGGCGTYQSYGCRQVELVNQAGMAFRLPISTDQYGAPNGSVQYFISYTYTSDNHSFTRSGVMEITAYIGDGTMPKVQLSEEYNFAGGEDEISNSMVLDFTSRFVDASGAAFTGAPGQIVSTIEIDYTNGPANDHGFLDYAYKVVV